MHANHLAALGTGPFIIFVLDEPAYAVFLYAG
jgi:hypothetical protein